MLEVEETFLFTLGKHTSKTQLAMCLTQGPVAWPARLSDSAADV
jgi:hypothetical protein